MDTKKNICSKKFSLLTIMYKVPNYLIKELCINFLFTHLILKGTLTLEQYDGEKKAIFTERIVDAAKAIMEKE